MQAFVNNVKNFENTHSCNVSSKCRRREVLNKLELQVSSLQCFSSLFLRNLVNIDRWFDKYQNKKQIRFRMKIAYDLEE